MIRGVTGNSTMQHCCLEAFQSADAQEVCVLDDVWSRFFTIEYFLVAMPSLHRDKSLSPEASCTLLLCLEHQEGRECDI
jgi:hypothetical protein